MDASSLFRPLKPYLDAFVECDAARRFASLEQGLTPSAEIWGPIRVFTGYAEISEKIDGFHQNWPDCRLVATSGIVCFGNAGHFAMAIVSPGGSILANGHSVVELAADGRINRVLAFWGPQPPTPNDWPAHLSAQGAWTYADDHGSATAAVKCRVTSKMLGIRAATDEQG